MRIPTAGWPLLFAAALVVVTATCVCPQPATQPLPPPPPSEPPPTTAPAPQQPAPQQPAPQQPTQPAPQQPAPGEARQLLVPPDHPLYDRVEGTNVNNACQSDADCQVGGCSQEVCSADPGVITTCEKRLFPSQGGSCGCIQNQCSWYRPASADTGGQTSPAPTADEPDTAALPGTGKACTADGRCAAGLTCLSYYGIAGPRGPKFSSCERPCGKGKPACPAGQRCVTIADGPGAVCR